MSIFKQIIKRSFFLSSIKLFIFRIIWKKRNSHNFTRANNCFNLNSVLVGKGTYGNISVKHFGNSNEKLEIGNFCSIGPECIFILGGNHNYKKFSTYPFNKKYGNKKNESICRGPIIVEDDVWFGYGVTILSGVKIGKGAVIGAKSLVVSDIPPYSIAVGCPAKVIKYRFPKKIVDILEQIDFSKYSIETLIKISKYELNEDNISIFLSELEKG